MSEAAPPRGWHADAPASAWVARFGTLIPPGGSVLDLACGAGRHVRYLSERGFRVVAVDRDIAGIEDLQGHPGVEAHQMDLEDGSPFPFSGRKFDGVVVVNYLHRPLFPALVASLAPGGALIYETFARGNERFGVPSNPAFLLDRGELLDAVRPPLEVVAYEDLEVSDPRPAAVQRIAAVRRA